MIKNINIINPLVSVDYVYYTFAYVYGEKFGHFKEKEYFVSAIFGMLQLQNVVTIILFIWRPLPELIKSYDLQIVLIGFLLIFLLNIIRYKDPRKYIELSKRWGKDKGKVLILKRSGVIFYFILTNILLAYSILNK